MLRPAVVLAFVGSAAVLSAQSPAVPQPQPPPAFEVASVKPAPGQSAPRSGAASPDRFYVAGITLRNLIEYAYGLGQFRIVGGPEWAGSERWEVSARADRIASRAEMGAMVRSLITERFGLKTHVETRELPTYTLLVARSDGRLGPNMKPAVVDCEPFRSGQSWMPALDAPADTRNRCALTRMSWGGGTRTRYHAGWPMTRLAQSLETSFKGVIADRTGLTGSFDIELTYEDEEFAKRFPGPGKPREAPPLLTALQEQLGLRLIPSRGPVEVLVIDSVERPTPD